MTFSAYEALTTQETETPAAQGATKKHLLISLSPYDSEGLEELIKICEKAGVDLSIESENYSFECFVSDPSKLKKSDFNPLLFAHSKLNLIEETETQEDSQKYNFIKTAVKAKDLLKMASEEMKTFTLDCGNLGKKRIKCFIKKSDCILYVNNFKSHNKLSGGKCEFNFTDQGMKDLEKYIQFWFSRKEKQLKNSSSDWPMLEKLMNKSFKLT